MELNPGGQTAEEYLSNEPRTEGVGENVVEREPFEVVDCKIVKLRKTSSKFCNAKRIARKCTCGHSGVVENYKMVTTNIPNRMGAVPQ